LRNHAVARSMEAHVTKSSTDNQRSCPDRWRHNKLCYTTDLKLQISISHCFNCEHTGHFTLIRAQMSRVDPLSAGLKAGLKHGFGAKKQIRDSANERAQRRKRLGLRQSLPKKARDCSERWLAASTSRTIHSSLICENHLGVNRHAVCVHLAVTL